MNRFLWHNHSSQFPTWKKLNVPHKQLTETCYKHFYIHYKNIFSGIDTKCLGLTGGFDHMNSEEFQEGAACTPIQKYFWIKWRNAEYEHQYFCHPFTFPSAGILITWQRTQLFFKKVKDSEVTKTGQNDEGVGASEPWGWSLSCDISSYLINSFLWPFLLSQSVLPLLAGRVITLVVVPGVLVAIAAVLWLLELNEWEVTQNERSVGISDSQNIEVCQSTWYQLPYPP